MKHVKLTINMATLGIVEIKIAACHSVIPQGGTESISFLRFPIEAFGNDTTKCKV